jgi:hypothetical protein
MEYHATISAPTTIGPGEKLPFTASAGWFVGQNIDNMDVYLLPDDAKKCSQAIGVTKVYFSSPKKIALRTLQHCILEKP